MRQESHLYSKDVTVEFNETAYNNEELFSRWISEEYRPLFANKPEDEKDSLCVIDAASFHKTPDILKQLRNMRATPALIPGGCTSLVQPLDTSVNRPFKVWLREATEDYVSNLPEGEIQKWTTSQRRIMTTYTVATAWKKLCERPEMVQKAFKQCGISISPDGTEDHLIKIKDIPNSAIDFSGWEKAEEISTSETHEIPHSGDDMEDFSLQGEDLLPINNYRTQLLKDLKDLCRQRGLQVSGTKSVLIERLESVDRNN